MRDDPDFKTWGLVAERTPVPLRAITVWTDLYRLTGPLGPNESQPPRTCPVPDCSSTSFAERPQPYATWNAAPREICKYRIYALFQNLNVCRQHHGEVWPAVTRFAEAAATDTVRELMKKGSAEYSGLEVQKIKPLLVGVLYDWHRIRIQYGSYINPGLMALRRTLTAKAVELSFLSQVSLEEVAKKAYLDPPGLET